jgi:antitoxin component YwqK of YwqJK toxin-antitoxin module
MKPLPVILLILLCPNLSGQKITTTQFRGKVISIYPDSIKTLWERIPLINELPDGKYYGFYEGDTSRLRLGISFLNNKVNGEVIEYHSSPPTPLYLTTYKNGIKDGRWIEYSDDTILHEGYYKNGKEDGFAYSYSGPAGQKSEYAKYFYRNDTLIYKIWFKYDSTYYVGDTGYVYESNYTKKLLGYGKTFKDNKFGLWEQFHENGKLKSKGYYELFKEIDENISTRKIGNWTDYHENGKIARKYQYLNNQLFERITTVYSQFDSLGNLLDSNNFINGIGLYREFYPNGRIESEEYYSRTEIYDYLKRFDENGQLRLYDRFKKNKIRIYTHYFENGKTESVERYKYSLTPNSLFAVDGYYHGKQKYYNEDGSLNRIEKYRNGRKIKK